VKVQLGGVLSGLLPAWPQLLTPDPPIVANVQFRRALLMAVDRQQLTETINYGLGPVAHSWVQPDRPEGKAIEGSLVRYPYDPRASAQMIEELGYTKRADGFYQGADGTPLSFQLRTSEQIAVQVPSALAVKDAWQSLGLDVQVDVLPLAQSTDLRLRSTYPAFLMINRGTLLSPEGYFNQSAIPTPETNFVGGNTARYGTAETDALIARYVSTIPLQERMDVLGQIVHWQSDQATLLPWFFIGAAYVLGSQRLQNVLGNQVWNAHEWDLS
jgi:peptide/nickel transport system substrate-binding protein